MKGYLKKILIQRIDNMKEIKNLPLVDVGIGEKFWHQSVDCNKEESYEKKKKVIVKLFSVEFEEIKEESYPIDSETMLFLVVWIY